jgi:hypothetical protein
MCKKLVYLISFVLVLSLASNAFTAEDPSLIIYYSFDDVGDIITDQSGKGHDGVVVGDVTAETEGKVNGAANFASGSYLDLDGPSFPAEDIPTSGMTLAAWIKCENTGGHHAIFNARASDATWLIHPEARSNGEFRWLLRAWGMTTIFDVRAGVVPWGEWVHFAGIYDKASGKAYVYNNGELVGEADVETPLDIAGDYDQGARVGYNIDNARPFTGLMDEFFLYKRALSQAEIKKIMQGLEFPYAFGPDPADGAIHEDTWATLSWSPGSSAVSHDVYFGENLNDVKDGTGDTFQGNQTATFLIVGFPGFAYPDGLVPGTTYYWRIDEIEADGTIRKGDIWSFMVPPKTAYNPDPRDGAEFVDLNVELSWTKGFGAMLHTVYFSDNFDDVYNATGGASQGEATYTPGPLELEKVYYWRVDEFDAVDTYKGDVWSFTTPGAVGSLNPANGATDVKQTQVLEWVAADSAASHQVYFGTDKDAVRSADTASPEYKGTRNLGSESYDPGKLAWLTTYYWRVDEVNNVNPDSPWTGPLWSFTTADFLVVDDFESYNDLDPDDPQSNRIFKAWLDGLDNPTNGSVVGYDNPPFAEQIIVHSGSQSMPFAYDNSVGYSEVTLTLTYPRDWTENGVNTLTIWFRGDAANAAERMYVALNGIAVVSHDNPNASIIDTWTEWNIDLQAFADQGVDLTNVDTIAIGLGDKNNPQAGGSGKMYIDDIRLFRPAAGPVLKLDLGNSHNAEELEEGFTSFTIADSGSQIDGITVELSGTLDSRRRGAPAGVPFEQIYRDFIFSRPGAMTVTLSDLAANTTYEITIYAWDTSSAETRIADWTANGISVCQTVFDGTQDPPTAEDDYAFTGKATSDSTGTIFLESAPGEGTREPSGASHPFTFLNALVLIPTEPEPVVTDASLVIYYSFNEVGDIVADQSGKGHDGAVVGDVTAEADGKYGGAANFATGSYLDLDGPSFPAEDIPTSAMTLAAWIKCANTGGDHEIFSARASDNTWLIHPEPKSSGDIRWLLRSYGGTTIFQIRAGTMTWDEWLHFAGTYDKEPGKAALYINGELIEEIDVENPADIAGDWGQGARVGLTIDDARPFTGLMDEFRMYTRALSQDEILEIMQGM